MIPSLKYHKEGFNEIEQQTDVCFLIADVYAHCMQTLSLKVETLIIRLNLFF